MYVVAFYFLLRKAELGWLLRRDILIEEVDGKQRVRLHVNRTKTTGKSFADRKANDVYFVEFRSARLLIEAINFYLPLLPNDYDPSWPLFPWAVIPPARHEYRSCIPVTRLLKLPGPTGALWELIPEKNPSTGSALNDQLNSMLGTLGSHAAAIRAGFRFTMHGLRVGAASELKANGVEDALIQRLGRWKSECFRLYLIDAVSDEMSATDKIGAIMADWKLGTLVPGVIDLSSGFAALMLLASFLWLWSPFNFPIPVLSGWGGGPAQLVPARF